ncbi:MAG: DUF1573 domain-containing protein [Bacteroidia bacterium]|nr:DUF1573 domain-containing protein [Bacteroidia bacterium]
MKTSFLFLGFVFLIAACEPPKANQVEPQVSTDVINVPATASDKPLEAGMGAQMTFVEESHDFGKITQGEKVSYSFVFKNTGNSDLVISNASASCGCTVPNYPKTPVKPGQESKIDVVFDSSGKSGLVSKTVTLVTNCMPSTKQLTISTTIIVPEEE